MRFDRRFTPLVVVLVLSLGPVELVGARWLETLIRAGTLAAAAYALGRGRRSRVGALLLLGPILAVQALDLGFSSETSALASLALALLFLVWVLGVVVAEVLVARRVDPDVLMGGIAIYLLFGHIFGMLFVLIEAIDPGSFANLDPTPLAVERLQYFSFVTLTSLGYGDVAPLSLLARKAVVVEAVLGQVYLTVFVGRLVGYSFPEAERGQGASD